MNAEDLRIMEDTVAVLFSARRGEKPTDEQIEKFDDLYHKLKDDYIKINKLINEEIKRRKDVK